ncbi:hypothetical protein BOTCAL_0326g00100 [Botryotinia calthae]|uniref:Amino acid permease/ SLC12A domain-containing protein n=1 Tax=Botryotinia calthae TaxID=38488 RepID=A0A4Y8CVR0_9HELO|nr:hypothetical protein BOTCAL_0326g00100 [Botryotinia calthae]
MSNSHLQSKNDNIHVIGHSKDAEANHLHHDDQERPILADKLARSLSARQVQMIAIGGTIGTGLFLGTGKSLATGGPASILIAYLIVGFIVMLTMLSLGEMAAYVPIAGSFCTFAGRYVDDGLGFALTWNYWFNDAAYGELEYWLSLLKVVTITIFIILGIVVNCGGNTSHTYLGAHNWYIGDAPFVGGIGGFASVFVTASFAYGGTESIAITAGETKNPTKNLPRVVKNVFWRILIFYILSVFLIGLNIPYNYPKLSSKTTTTSPFTLVFQMVGAKAAGSFMNAVILTSVISAGNHALFAGTRLLYTLSVDRHAPQFFGKLNRNKVPWVAVLATSAISGLCFGASFIGAGQLWTWLQNLVGVSNQLAWIAIGVTSIRFRGALELQGRTHLLPYRNWTYPWGPWICVSLNVVIVLVQGWSCFSPTFSAVDFVSFYIELPIMAVMWLGWKWLKGTKVVSYEDMDLQTDVYVVGEEDEKETEMEGTARGKVERVLRRIF